VSAIAPTLEAFFITRLIQQREVSSHTIASYRDTFRLLFNYVHVATGKQPSKLDFEDLNAPVIGAFLEHLLEERGNTVRTRNARWVWLRQRDNRVTRLTSVTRSAQE